MTKQKQKCITLQIPVQYDLVFTSLVHIEFIMSLELIQYKIIPQIIKFYIHLKVASLILSLYLNKAPHAECLVH